VNAYIYMRICAFINICGRPFILYFLLLFSLPRFLPVARPRTESAGCAAVIFLARPERETKDREVRAISQCQSTHGAAPIRSTTVNERQEKIVEGASERERERERKKKRMNDGYPSLLRLITCPSFVCVYFSFPHLFLLVLFCISAVTNGRPPSLLPSLLCLFVFLFSIFSFAVHFLTGMRSFHSWRIRLQKRSSFHSCKKERKKKGEKGKNQNDNPEKEKKKKR